MAEKKTNKQKSKSTPLSKKVKNRFVIILWSLLAVGVLSVGAIFYMTTKGWIGYLPPLEELQNPKNKYASQIISADGEQLGTFFTAKDNRVGTTYSELSPNIIKALIATEDERFIEHSGVDFVAVGRVLVKTLILQQRNAGGGSTITQQLAKQLYSPTARNLFERALQKPIEWVIAVQLERLYTKEEILTMYLDKFDFLNNAVGIKTASWVYFGVLPSELTVEQAATLVGMCKNPSLFNPASAKRRDKCEERRNIVLNQMVKSEYLTVAEYDSISQIPLTLNYNRVDHKLGTAPYFREYLRNTITAKKPQKKNYADWQTAPYGQYYMDSIEWETNPLYGFCEKNPKSDGTKYDIYRDGLKIYTTIDSRMQAHAEAAVEEHFTDIQAKFFKQKSGSKKAPFMLNTSDKVIEQSLNQAMRYTDRYRDLKKNGASDEEIKTAFNTPVEMNVFSYTGNYDTIMTPIDSIRYYKHFARCGMMSIDPMNGHVKAYVGGPNFSYFQYDMVNKGRRQVGSTVKPFLYSLAMGEGYWPCDTTINQEITLYDKLGREFTPRNSGKSRIGETVTLRWGLQQSNNWITAYLMSLLTPEQLVIQMRSFGIKGKLEPVVSICLGPSEVSVAEMVGAYTAFPNKGIRTNAVYVTHIEDNNGNRIAEFTPITEEVFNEETSYKMLNMLQGVMDGGTGIRARYKYGFNAPAGGKTGTTQENSDGWFMGFTPQLVTGVWVGWEDRTAHFANMIDGQGAATALPIWGLYMKRVYDDEELDYSDTMDFNIPKSFDSNAGCR